MMLRFTVIALLLAGVAKPAAGGRWGHRLAPQDRSAAHHRGSVANDAADAADGAGASVGLGADAATCTLADLVRTVALRGNLEKGPCRVDYHKVTEAPDKRQTLWTAKADGAYCKKKFDAFVAKLGGLGWKCELRAQSGGND